jgi:CRP-like cAMP-binding protein
MEGKQAEVLRVEPDLANSLPRGIRERARQACVAVVAHVPRGEWDPRAGLDPGGFGYLVISGYLVRRVGQGGRFGAENASLPFEPRWTAITAAELALLDLEFARRAAPFPAVGIQLVDRAMLRSRHLAIAMAIVHQPRIDQRLHMLLWHYADRWGKVGASGATIDVPLTHEVLAELVGARRPTVSTALGQLAKEGKVIRSGRRWRLQGGPPLELAKLGG